MVLQIETRKLDPDITVLALTGKVTMGRESQRIEPLVNDLLRQDQKKIIFDVSGVDYMDSTGIGIIAYCSATVAQAGGKLHLAGAGGKVEHLLNATRLANIISCHATVEAAGKAF